MGNQLIAWIRSVVPIGVGSLVSFLVSLGIEIDSGTEASLIAGLTGVVAAVYYTVVQLLSRRWEWIGWFLGYKAQPEYDTSDSK